MVMGLWHLPWGLRLVKPAGGFQDGEKQVGTHPGWQAGCHSALRCCEIVSLSRFARIKHQAILQPCYEYEPLTLNPYKHQTDQNRKRAPAILSGVVTAWQSQSVGGQASTTKTWEPKALLQTSWLTGTDGLKQDIGRNPAAPDVHSQQRTKNAALDF